MRRPRFLTDASGAAGAEMALMLPLLLALMFGALEGGHFLWREHQVVMAAREGARYAARLDLADDCTDAVSDTAEDRVTDLVQEKLGTGATVDLQLDCYVPADADDVQGLYADQVNGAPVVTVAVNADYRSLFVTLGFATGGMKLNAWSRSPVIKL